MKRTTRPLAFADQALPEWHRAVLKVGSSLLTGRNGGLSTRNLLGLVQFMSASREQGREVVLVSSGAVAAGRLLLAHHGDITHAARQAMAALGQTRTIAMWQRLFDHPLAQVLLTPDDMRDRRRYLNARATLKELLEHGILPVVNENDTVTVGDQTLGDNDNLAAIVAGLIDADLLLIATDVDGLYSADPRTDPDARPIDDVSALAPQIFVAAGGHGSEHGTGGMLTKVEAARKAAAAGIDTVLFNGRNADVTRMLTNGRVRGTRLRSDSTPLQARKYWLCNMLVVDGSIQVDTGAARAIRGAHASLLPTGVVGAAGEFQRGDMVEIVEAATGERIANGITQYGAAEINLIHGYHSSQIKDVLGYSYEEEVVNRDDLVTIDEYRGREARGTTL